MSLLIWLPLNGDIKNYGASGYTTTLVGSLSSVAGKTGPAYRFDTGGGTGNGISLNTNLVGKLGSNFSIACWVNPYGNHVHYNGTIFSSGNWNSYCWAFGLSQNNTRVDLFGNWYNQYIDCTVPTNTWTHLACVNNNGTCSVYKNGVLVGTGSDSAALNSDASNCCVGRETYADGYFGFNGAIQDLRVYNHCLSPDEVKEISKGLVLHYPLNQPNRNPNLISGFTSGGRTAIEGNTVVLQPQTTTADTYFQINLNEALVANTDYTLSCCIKGMNCNADWYFPLFAQSNPLSKNLIIYKDKLFTSVTFSLPSGSTYVGNTAIFMDDTSRPSSNPGYITLYNFKLEKGSVATPWCPPGEINTIEYDCSGYNRNGTASGNLTLVSEAGRGGYSTSFSGGNNTAIQIPFTTAVVTGEFTASMWFYKSEFSSYSWDTIFGGPSGFELETKNGGSNTPVIYAYSWGQGSFGYTLNTWHHLVMTRNSTETKFYLDGTLKLTGSAGSIPGGSYFIGAWMDTAHQLYKGLVSDFRVYASVLSAADVAQEYHRYAAIYSNHSFSTNEANEYLGSNLIEKTNTYLTRKTWSNGYWGYTQSNCSVTLTDEGARIQRPANLSYSSYSQWGGLVIAPYGQDGRDVLFKGHTYILKWHAKGKSSNACNDIGWSNQVGWGGGGLYPEPSNTSSQTTPANFNGEMECWYKWTINDDVYKVCTTSYSSFVAGNTYLSYNGFKIGFGYTDTGEMGTDLYISNVRMYDITNNNQKVNIKVSGVVNGNIVEDDFDKVSMMPDGEVYTTQFIERI